MLYYLLYGLFIVACIVLIVSVLLQPGKADAGALFTSSISSTAFGPRGTQTLLAKITIGAAAAFMLIALMLSFGVGGSRSLLQSEDEGALPATTQTSPTPAASPAASPAGSPQADASPPPEQQQGATSASPAAAENANPVTASPAASPER